MQAIVRDARVREEAHVIQAEVRRLVEEVERLQNRMDFSTPLPEISAGSFDKAAE